MKTSFITTIVLFFSMLSAQAQDMCNQEITWFGLDYSKVSLYGSSIHFKDLPRIKNHYFEAWNQLILNEQPKYNLGKFYKKTKVNINLDMVSELNLTADESKLLNKNEINCPVNFTTTDIAKMVSNYKVEGTGTGLIYIVEALDKRNVKGIIHVVFFDIASKKVLWTEDFKTGARGAGFRNFWASSIFNTMKISSAKYRRACKRR